MVGGRGDGSSEDVRWQAASGRRGRRGRRGQAGWGLGHELVKGLVQCKIWLERLARRAERLGGEQPLGFWTLVHVH